MGGIGDMTQRDFPALTFIMTDDTWTRPPISPPSECFACPFATARGEENGFSPPNPSDPGEGYYACALIGKPATNLWAKDYVWGEQPECTHEDWAFRLASEWAILTARLDPESVDNI